MGATPKVLILRTGGTNCDEEMEHAFILAGAETERLHIHRFLKKERHLGEFHILALPGGFSYGDDIAAGKLLANELIYLLRDPLETFIAEGKLVLGVCNGFQALARAGLLPGLGSFGVQEATLTNNDSGKFECRWIRMKPELTPCVFTQGISKTLTLPVAHGEGKFFAPSGVLEAMRQNLQIVLRYVDDEGGTDAYPANPNGSLDGIAAVCNPTGTVFGLMPHPERFVRRIQHPRWTRENIGEYGDGFLIFKNAVEYAREHVVV